MEGMYEIPVSTIEVNNLKYGAIGIVSQYHPGMFTKQVFKYEKTADEIIQELIKLLVKKAKDIEADAIYGLRIQMLPAPGGMAMSNNYIVYGTAVKIIKNV